MNDRIDPPGRSAQPGPWPEVTDLRRLYDHGWPWCSNADAHPDARDGYPDLDGHLPWHECRSREAYVDDARSDLDGEFVSVSIYTAAAFRFGALRGEATSAPRVVVETCSSDDDEQTQRVSLTPGETLRLARVLVHFADLLTFAEPAA